MNARTNGRISEMFAADERTGRFTSPRNGAEARVMRRATENGELIRVRPRIYARATYHDALTPPQRMRHQVLAAAALHPQWVFARESALSLYPQIEQPYELFAQNQLAILSKSRAHDGNLQRLPWHDDHLVTAGNIVLTDLPRTLFDCGIMFDFRLALPLFDSYAAHGGDLDEIRAICAQSACDTRRIQRLLEYCDPLADNGGESQARAVVIELGFMRPLLQHLFANPNAPEHPLQTDMLWYGPNGALIVAEFDGMRKYGTDSQSIKTLVARQNERDGILRAQGVTAIVHFTYDDLCQSEQFRRKLEEAGVPYRDSRKRRWG
ncbi:hypothetical protein [Bifidobacterium animalis]|uniref:hypothetical protein n=1 Tax=Bifidobacterium animalis TaxID=28025 RepID=UPI0010218787|nr:hypothetical protein [Bifidobacterium animalis]